MDFLYLFRVLVKKKWLILGSALVAALLALVLTSQESRKYLSTTQISTGFTMTDDVRDKDNTFNIVEAENKFSNVLITFTSPSVISLLSYNLILHDLNSSEPYERLTEEDRQSDVYKAVNIEEAKRVFRQKLESMTPLTSYKPEEKKLLEFLTLYGYDHKTLNKYLSVYRVGRTDFIQIDYLSDNPELSAFVVNNLYQEFMRYYGNLRGSRTKESIDTLKSIMDKKKQELDVKSALLRNRGIIDAEVAGTSTYDLIATLEKDLQDEKSRKNNIETELKKVDQRIQKVKNRTAPSDNDAQNDEVVIARRAMNNAYADWVASGKKDNSLYDKYLTLKNEYNEKYASSGGKSNSRDEEKPGESLSELQNKRADILFDIQASTKNIASLQGQIGALKGEVNSISTEGQTAESLKKEWDMANKDYLDAKQKYNDATDMNGASVSNFRQVVTGQPAIEPEPSKRKIIIAMAGTAALVTTMLVIILLTYLDSSIKTPIVFQKTVNLKLISMVNFMDLKNKSLSDIVSNKEKGTNQNDRTNFNAFRESIRKLRYEIEHSGKKVFLFTSTKKGQGKTTLIQALSYSLSLSKKKILIIDTNFCNNDLTVQLNAEPILEKIVPYKADGKALLDQVKIFSKNVNEGTVFAIGSEGGDYTPSEVLPRENLLHHLDALTAEFDYVFLEGPPLNDFSDSRELAQYVEGVIAVFSAKHIIKQIDKQSIAFFKELNGKFCGSILNMVDLENVNAS
jgi:polysaccharide biosynthesis transport protein